MTAFGAKDARCSSPAPTNHRIRSTSLGSWLGMQKGWKEWWVWSLTQWEWPQTQSQAGPGLTPAQWFYYFRNKIKVGEIKGFFFFFHFPWEIIDKALTHFISVITGQSELWVSAEDAGIFYFFNSWRILKGRLIKIQTSRIEPWLWPYSSTHDTRGGTVVICTSPQMEAFHLDFYNLCVCTHIDGTWLIGNRWIGRSSLLCLENKYVVHQSRPYPSLLHSGFFPRLAVRKCLNI